MKLEDLSQLIQDDLDCLLESQFGLAEYLDEVKALACQIIVDRINEFKQSS